MRSQVRMILYGAFIIALAFAAVPAAHATTAPTAAVRGLMSPNNFPGQDADFHTYAEMVSEINAVAAQYPSLVRVSVIGQSYEGRNLYAIKVSDNVAVDEAEPEVLYNAHMHAREHITVEMALYLLNMFTGQYDTDSRVHSAVDRREIWILPDLNPDGGEFDISTGSYLSWRKNRQPTSGSTAVGTDINRNFGYQWGCCGGSSGDPASLVFRGPSAYSAPESRAYRDFVQSRRIDGVQQIKTAIDFHSYSELVLWPYSYTTADTAPGLNADQQATFRAIGEQMAATNDYQARQASEGVGYLADGSSIDYLWGAEGIWAYTIEMFPKPDSSFGFYPPDEVIPAETARNRDAALLLAEYADCPYRAIGKTEQYCAAPPPSVVAVPDVRGSTQAQARTALESVGLVLGGVSFVVDTTCEWINVVKFQNPSAGNQVLLGSAVSVTIGTLPSTPCP